MRRRGAPVGNAISGPADAQPLSRTVRSAAQFARASASAESQGRRWRRDGAVFDPHWRNTAAQLHRQLPDGHEHVNSAWSGF